MTKNICKSILVFLLTCAPAYAIPIADPITVLKSWEGENLRLDLDITTVLNSNVYVPIWDPGLKDTFDVVTNINGQLTLSGNPYSVTMAGPVWIFPDFIYMPLNIENFGFHVLRQNRDSIYLNGSLAKPLQVATPTVISSLTAPESVQVESVPEPSTLLIVLVSVVCLFIWRLK